MRRAILFTIAAALGAALVPQAGAQTAPPFLIRVQQGTNVQFVGDGGTLHFPADGIGRPVDGEIAIQYTGTAPNSYANLNQILLSGPADYAITYEPNLSEGPLVLPPGSSPVSVKLRYTPSNSRGAAGKVTFNYSNETGRTGSFSVNLSGTAPEFAFSYQVQPNGNTVQLAPGTTVALPATALNQTASALITLTNRGTGAGAVNAVTLSGSDKFAVAGAPLLPATVDPAKTITFSVRFTPTEFAAVTADVQVDFTGASLQFRVSGSGLGPAYAYAVVDAGGGAAAVEPNGLIRLPDATVGGERTSVVVRVTNTGNDNATISTLSISGAGFILAETPIMPYTLLPEGSIAFRVQFGPTTPGRTVGRLRIGNDNFDVAGTALGPNMTFSYAAAGSTSSVAAGGTVVLPAVAVGETSTVQFTVKNEGTAPQDVISISASGTGTVFSVSGLPSLPRRIEAGAGVTFTVSFAPVTTGASAGTLKVDTQTFALSGSGNPPAALPSYTFTGSSGSVEPAQQPAVGLTLASPYGLALNGVLTLKFTSDVFADDPAVQFSSGGRTVNFTIPAGTRQAVFANGATQMRLQSGTVAGTITVTPSFTTVGGGIDMTPSAPQAATMTVAQSAPRLSSVVVSAKANNSITVQVTGYATGRNLTQLDFQFTAVSGENLGTSRLTLPVEPTFSAWYQSSGSAAYGSQFTATVTFTLAGDITNTKTITALADTIQSISATLTNRQGVSNSMTVSVK
jgi:hypothetical protein